MRIEDVNNYFSAYLNQYDFGRDAREECNRYREISKESFLKSGMPSSSHEAWSFFPWEKICEKSYNLSLRNEKNKSVENYFKCGTQDINSDMFNFLNGWYLHKNAPLTRFPNGLIAGSICEAFKICPDFVLPYFNSALSNVNGLVNFNSALWQDGFFVYVPSNLHVHNPIQLVNMVKSYENILIQPRNLIVLGEGSSLKLVHCDESLECKDSLINTVTEICVEKNAHFDYFKLENKDNQSSLINHLYIRQEENSEVNTHTTIFNGELVHNTIHVELLGENANVNNNGLYLADGKQNISNYVFIRHKAPNCKSNQLYKGILDDYARTSFTSHVLVEPHAQKTEAHQTNRNILLKDSAKISAKPFLEIYADDVKCTHGASVGQLDEDAVFYMRSRGICEKNARILLMHAYAMEVIDKMDIPALCERTENLVSKRLTGENISCGNCMQSCDKKITFNIETPDF